MRLLLFAALLILKSPLCQSNADTNCKCWISWYTRLPCVNGVDLTEDVCATFGCCYHHDKDAPLAPKCYKATGTCPQPECLVDLNQRKSCTKVSKRLLLPKGFCEDVGCCYNDGFEPYCYEPKYEIVNPTQSVVDYSREDPNHLVPFLFRKFERLGLNKIFAVCGLRSRRRKCGPTVTSRGQCIRFGCCWEVLQANWIRNTIPNCFHAKRFIISRGAVATDIIFLLDGSGSVTRTGFQLIKVWVKGITKEMRSLNSALQFGVVQYSSNPFRHITLGQHPAQSAFDTAVDAIPFSGRYTLTARGLTFTINEFQLPSTRYPNSRRVLILITDGLAGDARNLPAAKLAAEQKQIEIFGVGVGRIPNLDELNSLAGQERVFFESSFAQLNSVNKPLIEAIGL